MDFLAASGVQALGALMERPQVGPMELHMALVCLDGLTRAAGVAGCEAALGWWMPSPEDADPQVRSRTLGLAHGQTCAENNAWMQTLPQDCAAMRIWRLGGWWSRAPVLACVHRHARPGHQHDQEPCQSSMAWL